MLKAGGASVRLAGFRRIAKVVGRVEDCATIDLGETRDGALLARFASVASVAIRLKRLESIMRGSDVVLARNLEMLFLATKARRRYAPDAALVYECLDIHRLLTSRNLPSQLLRAIENELTREVDLVLTSSSRFITEYFSFRKFDAPVKVFENKVLPFDSGMARQPSLPSGPPWKIGWFGMIRCRRSFAILSDVARELSGNLQIKIAGRASPREFPEFEKLVARCPHLSFAGPYRFEDLPDLYGGVHFSWAIDFFEQGLNSSWLLPNRIYESSFFGAIPIAEHGVETARWLNERGIGVILSGDLKTSLLNFLSGLTCHRYGHLARALQQIPTAELAMTEESCGEILKEFGRASDSLRGRP
jgi:succinoglycan biosynthesis protein ExoL